MFLPRCIYINTNYGGSKLIKTRSFESFLENKIILKLLKSNLTFIIPIKLFLQ